MEGREGGGKGVVRRREIGEGAEGGGGGHVDGVVEPGQKERRSRGGKIIGEGVVLEVWLDVVVVVPGEVEGVWVV